MNTVYILWERDTDGDWNLRQLYVMKDVAVSDCKLLCEGGKFYDKETSKFLGVAKGKLICISERADGAKWQVTRNTVWE